MIFFRKIGKITLFHTKLTSRLNATGRKIQKIKFCGKTSTNFKSFPLQQITQITIIVENTENSHNPQLYTIQNKLVRNSHVLSQKSGIFSSATTIVLQTSAKCSCTKFSKQQLTAHMSIVKRIMVSVTNTHPSSSNITIVVTGVSKQSNIAHKLLNK